MRRLLHLAIGAFERIYVFLIVVLQLLVALIDDAVRIAAGPLLVFLRGSTDKPIAPPAHL